MSSNYHSFCENIFIPGSDPAFFCDDPAYADRTPATLKSCQQYDLLSDRRKLREFARAGGLKTPSFIVSDQFPRLSAWAVKQNHFPMVIKSAVNLADGTASFVLKAFRELPEFFEIISEKQTGGILLEEFIVPKARVEITWFNGKIRIIAQTGLDKSMRLRHAWRAFPARLPDGFQQQILTIASLFKPLLEIAAVPIRFSFALTSAGPVLISINSGYNRPEYHPGWRKSAHLPDLADPDAAIAQRFCRLMTFYDQKTGEFDAQELKQLCSETFTQIAVSGTQIMVFLSSDKTATLQEDSRRAEALFKHLAD